MGKVRSAIRFGCAFGLMASAIGGAYWVTGPFPPRMSPLLDSTRFDGETLHWWAGGLFAEGTWVQLGAAIWGVASLVLYLHYEITSWRARPHRSD